ncbi:MAG TPA: 3-phosphoshikimate 1-carboxyvinyltransferase [Bryobacteraceae bacterium]|nr:3-phosphoshikimate 1-carboxyvinyltransferase [Bryobacteraceae bacterium]
MQEHKLPARRLQGSIRVPGDKSISHRYAMLAAIAEGTSRIHNYASGEDCHSTLSCLEALGVQLEKTGGDVQIQGAGLDGLREPAATLDAGNSGSTIRMLAGILAGQPFSSRIAGDASLSRRPMDRIMVPLRQMGAGIDGRSGRYPPIEIRGAQLQPIDYTLPVASAQVKTCVLFAGLFASGETTVREPVATRDHTELALTGFGAAVTRREGRITVAGRPILRARELVVPGDLSSAAFFLVAALLVPGSSLLLQGVGLNPTRTAILDFLTSMGAGLQLQNLSTRHGELVGDIQVNSAPVRGGVIEKEITAALIDEVPVLAVLGAVSKEGLTVRNALELRLKETDRIATVAENLRRMGVAVKVHGDGFFVPGGQKFRAAALDSFGDHRIAMAFAVAALAADGECVIEGAEAASVSFPEFYQVLRRIAT